MHEAWKLRWLEALRSGRYQQGRGRLHLKTKEGQDEYCCIGVLGCLLVDDGKAEWELVLHEGQPETHEGREVFRFKQGGNLWATGFLPDLVAHELGFDADAQSELAEMNDKQAASFEEIADYIETSL